MTYNLFHYSDPQAKNYEPWHYVYLHGEAERHNESVATLNDWHWEAPDLVCSDSPMPPDGDYEGVLYGVAVTIFIRKRHPKFDCNWLGGRVAVKSDTEAYEHASKVEEWR